MKANLTEVPFRGVKETANKEKFIELILYIAEKSRNDPDFGAVKLNKLLCFSDFMHFSLPGKPITGQRYQKLDMGPAPRALLPVRLVMIERGYFEIESRLCAGYQQARVLPKRNAVVTDFSAKEVEVVDQVIAAMQGANAARASEMSHCFITQWEDFKDQEDIPPEIVFVSRRDLTQKEREHASGITRTQL